MARCKAPTASSGLPLLSNGTTSNLVPLGNRPRAFRSSIAYRYELSSFSPVAAKGPESASMNAIFTALTRSVWGDVHAIRRPARIHRYLLIPTGHLLLSVGRMIYL